MPTANDAARNTAAVTRLTASYDAIPAGAPVRLAKRTSNLFRPRDAIDIVLVAIVLYRIFVMFKETRAVQMLLGLAGLMVGAFLFGPLADKIGRKPMMIFFGASATVFTYPIFMTLETVRSAPAAFLLVMTCLIMVTGYSSINAIIKAEMFPADIRALGVREVVVTSGSQGATVHVGGTREEIPARPIAAQ